MVFALRVQKFAIADTPSAPKNQEQLSVHVELLLTVSSPPAPLSGFGCPCDFVALLSLVLTSQSKFGSSAERASETSRKAFAPLVHMCATRVTTSSSAVKAAFTVIVLTVMGCLASALPIWSWHLIPSHAIVACK